MANDDPLVHSLTRSSNSSEPSSWESSNTSIATPPEENKKIGRPSQWTESRQRKLARLYLYSNLPPKDIRLALHDRSDNWLPEKETTTKTFNALLDKDPRWLRPKNEEEMEQRILALANCKAQRNLKRQLRQARLAKHFDIIMEESITNRNDPDLSEEPTVEPDSPIDQTISKDCEEVNRLSWTEFTHTPVQDLLAMKDPELSEAAIKELWQFVDSDLNAEVEFQTSAPGGQNGKMPALEETADFQNTSLDEISTHRNENTLVNHSPLGTDGITKLLQAYSICDSPAASTTDMSRRLSAGTALTELMSTEKSPSYSQPTEGALPNAFLVADFHRAKQGPCFPGLKVHDSGSCWCMLDLESLPTNKRWYIGPDAISPLHMPNPPRSLHNLNLRYRDTFGNTILHLLASRGASTGLIQNALTSGMDGNAKNTAGQTFLHCLPYIDLWNPDLHFELSSRSSLQLVVKCSVDITACDPFGRTFAHLLTYNAFTNHLYRRDSESRDLFELLVWSHRSTHKRDAFGWIPTNLNWRLSEKIMQANYGRTGIGAVGPFSFNVPSQSQQSFIEEVGEEIRLPASANAVSLITMHARLLETAALALDVPNTEDSRGRNGLHCLAEVSLDLHKVTDVLHSGAKTSKKRKRDQIVSEPSVIWTSGLQYRYGLLQQMIKSGVDVNSYDKFGNTVLMAFVSHLDDGLENNTLSAIFRFLVNHGADPGRRNRKGETALHIAVKLATRLLWLSCYKKVPMSMPGLWRARAFWL
ncbi:uncharacterized protein LY89DRAFT_735483 [Mollisia scopiformis]|uniref:Uncharacterized protein n=1 Tax=Mollisia scopiformis TaxID=149040 RepID=A0A194X5K6_MOLSC|nr:uncharacterized protein LY89DRAFT_735483 [Mollisia scopiformis]KUJ15364.1 hypothetical protein LY89DRAFT_735483 [Mollisia scopiformis]